MLVRYKTVLSVISEQDARYIEQSNNLLWDYYKGMF